MNIKEIINRERWDHNNCVIIDPNYQVKRRAETPEINAHNESLDRIAKSIEKRIYELEKAVNARDELKSMLEDVVNELDLSDSAIEKHGPLGTAPSELVRLVLEEKDRTINLLRAGFKKIT